MLRLTLLAAALLALAPGLATAHHETCGPWGPVIPTFNGWIMLWAPAFGSSCVGAAVEHSATCPLPEQQAGVGPAHVELMDDAFGPGWCVLAGAWLPA